MRMAGMKIRCNDNHTPVGPPARDRLADTGSTGMRLTELIAVVAITPSAPLAAITRAGA